MVDNTIALRVQTPQLESPINRMAKFMQLQAYKAQADTAQQTTAKNAMLNQAYAAAVDPKSGAIDYNKAAAFLAANGGGAYAPDVLSSGAAATTAETGAAKGKFELKRSQIEASVRDLASYKTPADATAHLERSVAAGLVDPQTATALAAEIPRDPAQFEGWRTTKVRSLLTAAQQLETKFDAQNFGSGQRTIAYPAYAGGGGATVVPGSEVANTISPDAASSARTAANRLAFDQKSEVARALMEGVLPEAVGLGGMPAPSAGAGAPMAVPGAAAAPMAAPAGAAAPTAAPAAPAVGPNGAPLARDKREAERFSELTKKMPVAEAALKTTIGSIDEQINLVQSIRNDPSLSEITGSGYAPYQSTIQGFNPFDSRPNLADLQSKIGQLSAAGMFSGMQELKAASASGSTGLGSQTEAEGEALRQKYARLDQKQSLKGFQASLDEVLNKLIAAKANLNKSYAAEFAPVRGGAAAPEAAPTGGGGGLTVTAPDGSAHQFPNQAAADAFRKAIGQ